MCKDICISMFKAALFIIGKLETEMSFMELGIYYDLSYNII
jgi:hypothetical protein